VTHEHRIEILPQDANFALELDARSAEGWELVVAMVAGWAPTGILGADGRAAAVPVLSCVFRRAKSPESIREHCSAAIERYIHDLPTPEGRADDHLIVKG
jgi:hypothetical protein